jgi:hypothetical protein
MDFTPQSFLSADEQLTIRSVAAELDNDRLSPERRAELLRKVAEIAERYSCDPWLAEES